MDPSNKKLFEIKRKILLEKLTKHNYLVDKCLIKAFSEIPLEEFIPKKHLNPSKVYEDMPTLFFFQSPESYRTISAPHMISIMLQGLALNTNDDLLILGAKSGYIAALAHKLCPNGEIIVLEANAEIAKITMKNLKKLNLDENISVIVKNPLDGMPDLSPWQKILVTGAINQERIYPLLRQLDPKDGVLYAPIGEDFVQTYTQILRTGSNEFYGKKQLQVRFTPLMTQVELDELELVTDFDDFEEFEIVDDPNKVEETLKKVSIKYASSFLEEVGMVPFSPLRRATPINKKDRDLVVSHLNGILEIVKNLKKEDNIGKCFDCIDDIDTKIDRLKKYKGYFNIKLKRIQNFLNQIISYNILRKEFEKMNIADSDVIEKKIQVINDQLESINSLRSLINEEIDRIKKIGV